MKFGTAATFGTTNTFGLASSKSWQALCDDMQDRLLVQFREQPNMLDMVCEWAKREAATRDVLTELSYLFDLANVNGFFLDRIGGFVDLPRFGLDDTTYRRAIGSQILSVLPSTGEAENIIAIAKEWVTGKFSYTDFGTRTFHVFIDNLPTDPDLFLVKRFIGKARLGGYLGRVLSTTGDGLQCDSVSVAVSTPGVMDSVTSPIAGAEEMPGMVTT